MSIQMNPYDVRPFRVFSLRPKGSNEVDEMRRQFVVRFIEESPHGRVLDRAIHVFDPTLGPWTLGLGQSMIVVGAGAGDIKGVRAERLAIR